jgi:hypothetical protein
VAERTPTHAVVYTRFMDGAGVADLAVAFRMPAAAVESGLRARFREIERGQHTRVRLERQAIADRALELARSGMMDLIHNGLIAAGAGIDRRVRWIAAAALMALGWSCKGTATALGCDRQVVTYGLDNLPAELRPVVERVTAALKAGEVDRG